WDDQTTMPLAKLLPVVLSLAMVALSIAQTQDVPLEPVSKLKLENVKAEPVTYKGRKAVRITDVAAESVPDGERLAILTGTDFQNGTIEVDFAGDTPPGANPLFRAFTGIAFRVAPDGSKYECLYLRPKNGLSDDELQRNHSAQAIA